MRFICLYKPAAEEGRPPTQEHMVQMGNLIEEMTKAGVLLETGGCHPSARGSRIRLSDENFTVTDGPFTETKEIIGGYAVIQVQSKEEAVEWTKRFLKVAGDGESEIRLLHEASDFGPEVTPEIREQEARARSRMAANR
ncbi:MAG: hypothetical protein GEV06_23050 [Luteitalea sp.]|nr:hypothetical protein [Luteitalea sp.]